MVQVGEGPGCVGGGGRARVEHSYVLRAGRSAGEDGAGGGGEKGEEGAGLGRAEREKRGSGMGEEWGKGKVGWDGRGGMWNGGGGTVAVEEEGVEAVDEGFDCWGVIGEVFGLGRGRHGGGRGGDWRGGRRGVYLVEGRSRRG